MSDANLIAGLREFAARNGITLPLSAEVTVRGGGGKAASLTLGAEELLQVRPVALPAVPAAEPETTDDLGLSEKELAIVNVIRAAHGPLTTEEIAAELPPLSPDNGTFKRRLRSLVERGVLVVSSGGGYSISQTESSDVE